MSCYQHRYPWPSLITPPYSPLLPAGPPGYIPYQYRAAVCRFELVVLHLPVHVKRSTGVHHLWVCPYFSSSFCDGWQVAVQLLLCRVLSPGLVQYCSQHSCVVAAKLFLHTFIVSIHVVHPYSSIDTNAAWQKLHFILSVRSDFYMTHSLLIAIYAFASRVSMSVSVDEYLLPR